MPCYGETTCKLCMVGIYDGNEVKHEHMHNLIGIKDLKLDIDIQSGAIYIGGEYPIGNLVRHPHGLMGVWINKSDLTYDFKTDNNPIPEPQDYRYDLVHSRCWEVIKEFSDPILLKTGAETLCKGAMMLLGDVYTSIQCPQSDCMKSHVELVTIQEENKYFNVIARGKTYYIRPLYEIKKYMGQGCDYKGLKDAGLNVPTRDDVRKVIKLMLNIRDWSKLVIPYSRDCLYCCEERSKEEMECLTLMETMLSKSEYEKTILEYKQRLTSLRENAHKKYLKKIAKLACLN